MDRIRKRTVVGMETANFLYENGKYNLRFLEDACRFAAELRKTGNEVIFVMPEAFACRDMPGIRRGAVSPPSKEAAAAIGQCRILCFCNKTFADCGLMTAQILINSGDFRDKEKRQNLRNTCNRLLRFGVVPLVGRNDAVVCETGAVCGAGFAADDTAAAVASLLFAEYLVILSGSRTSRGELRCERISLVTDRRQPLPSPVFG